MSILTGYISSEQLLTYVLYCEWLIYATWRVVDNLTSLLQSIGASEKVFQLVDLLPSNQFLSKGKQCLVIFLGWEVLEGCYNLFQINKNFYCVTLISFIERLDMETKYFEYFFFLRGTKFFDYNLLCFTFCHFAKCEFYYKLLNRSLPHYYYFICDLQYVELQLDFILAPG